MHVVATAGHVDHGKSTLVRALTGMEPDRWAEERRRGLTIDLGFAWTDLPSGETVAFVDVPGHGRFVPNMLAGVGPVPAALFVVAADEGWMPQSAEHLAALDALGVRHGLLAVTRIDLADPADALAQARAALAATALRGVEAVAVSAPGGRGLVPLRAALDRLVAGLPPPDLSAPVRLWVDRVFTIRGSGTVVTGTLRAGLIRVGDELELPGAHLARVRGLHSLGQPASAVPAVARVAVNLRGVDRAGVGRGDTLVTPGRFHLTDLIDVRLAGDPATSLPPHIMLYIGSAAIAARVHPLGGDILRLRLARSLPLHLGDRALLRDPGRHHIVGAVTVLDVTPPPLRRRGAAARRAALLTEVADCPDEPGEIRRRRLVTRAALRRMGLAVTAQPVAGDWLADPAWWSQLQARLPELVEAYARDHPLDPAMPVEALRHALDLPDRSLVTALVTPPLVAADGRISLPSPRLPTPLRTAVDELRTELGTHPFRAPSAERLAELGLGPRELAAAARAGALTRITDSIVLSPHAPQRATQILADLPQPFTVSQARQALDTTRRTAIPLLDHLDRHGLTRRLPDDRRTVAGPARGSTGSVGPTI